MLHSSKMAHQQSLSPSSCHNDQSNQDWVCVKCNNLNFSFRKKCNRCKVQSREDNQRLVYADYYYYSHYYGYSLTNHQQLDGSNNCQPIEHCRSEAVVETRSEGSEGQVDDHLPSVSPLVKKYGSGGETRRGTGRGLFVWKLFGEQSWA